MPNQPSKKPSQAEIDDARRLLQRKSEPYLENLVSNVKDGAAGVEVSPARWIGFLDWLEADVGPQMMRGMRENEPKRQNFRTTPEFNTAHESWQRSYAEMFTRFEAFSQGRAAMNLDDPKFCRMFVSMIATLSSVSVDVAKFFTATTPKVEIDTHKATTGSV